MSRWEFGVGVFVVSDFLCYNQKPIITTDMETKKTCEAFEEYSNCDGLTQMIGRARKRSLKEAINQEVWKDIVNLAKRGKEKVLELFK